MQDAAPPHIAQPVQALFRAHFGDGQISFPHTPYNAFTEFHRHLSIRTDSSSQSKRIRGLTPQFDQCPHSPSKRSSHIDTRRFKRNTKVAAMLAVLCSMSILRTSSSRFLKQQILQDSEVGQEFQVLVGATLGKKGHSIMSPFSYCLGLQWPSGKASTSGPEGRRFET
ncbi:hypothetical protein AVEN_70562-1 [Araneus ventricosus]|uniref:Uncharacterized protein n=1 Tax=Araneus ventricosus TaxID=182803 RepID=A0A4Y2TVS9_ARAVE|nr:hypothetical protein AVEN_70562-1 [Araneus ventricosus]